MPVTVTGLAEGNLDVDDVAGLVGPVGVRRGQAGDRGSSRVDRDRRVGVEAAAGGRRGQRERRGVRRGVADRAPASASDPVPL